MKEIAINNVLMHLGLFLFSAVFCAIPIMLGHKIYKNGIIGEDKIVQPHEAFMLWQFTTAYFGATMMFYMLLIDDVTDLSHHFWQYSISILMMFGAFFLADFDKALKKVKEVIPFFGNKNDSDEK